MGIEVAAHIALEGVREVEGRVDATAHPHAARELLAATHLSCQKGGPEHDALDCVHCARFVNFRPSRDRETVTVRCQWAPDDPVSDLMTLLCALATVEADWCIDDADRRARRLGIRHLLVTRGKDLVGIVCRCDLVPPPAEGEYVVDRMQTELIAVRPDATLRGAADLMRGRAVGCLPVVEDGQLVGVVTRGDLRRAGVDEALLGARVWEVFGSCQGLRPPPALRSVLLLPAGCQPPPSHPSIPSLSATPAKPSRSARFAEGSPPPSSSHSSVASDSSSKKRSATVARSTS